MAATTTSPSKSDVGLREKTREWRGYLRNQRLSQDLDVPMFLADIDEYDSLLRTHCDRGLRGAQVLEIGFGKRPSRMAVLSAVGAAPIGVDLEVPLLSFNLATLRRIKRQNGVERLAKSVVRYALFDRTARRRLRRALAQKYPAASSTTGASRSATRPSSTWRQARWI